LIRSPTREGMHVAKAKGHSRGKQPKLTANQAKHLVELSDLGTYSTAELAELFSVGRSTIYRTLLRVRPVQLTPTDRSPQIRSEPRAPPTSRPRPVQHRPKCRTSSGNPQAHAQADTSAATQVKVELAIRPETCGRVKLVQVVWVA